MTRNKIENVPGMKVRRFSPNPFREDPQGIYVLHSEVAALIKDRCRAAVVTYKRVQQYDGREKRESL